MNTDALYLRADVQVEPLFDSWYAWSYLIPPATAARNLTERHLKIMDSYISAPEVHADAVRNPKMLGGPFIDYAGKRVDEIAALRDRTKRDQADLIQLSQAINALDRLLQQQAKGFTLQPLYAQIPPILRGYVELVYDLNNNPSFRIIEPLVYRGPQYKRSAQSLCLSLIRGDDRPFVLSTPRLDSPESVRLALSFGDERVDMLFRTKSSPKTLDWICDTLEVVDAQRPTVRSFLSSSPPPSYHRYTGPGARWRYFGHACILLETASVSILFDPVLSYTYESGISRYTYQDLPDKIDFVVVTHNHQDHILFETLLQIRHKVQTFVVPRSGGGELQDPSLRLLLQNVGFKNVVELGHLDSIDFEDGSIMGLPFLGEHADLNIQSKLGYLVRLGKRSLLVLADSCNIEPLLHKHLHREIGDVDVLFLGMECDGAPLTWLYGPLLTRKLDRAMDASRRFAGSNYEQAISIVSQFRCREAYVYAMGQEPWLNYVMSIKYTEQSRPIVESNRFVSECRARGMAAERLFGEKEIFLN
jgi:L-ascorbate metabolism protein UlaG (beta-lactamase superfamily)